MKGVAMLAVGLAAGLAMPAAAQCPPDALRAGDMCVDRHEASVWRIPDTLANKANLIAAIRAGMITSAAQLVGAQRRGEAGDDYGNCPDQGGGACTKNYAVSIAGVRPSRYITWFQALAACRSSGKRLLTNAEWQAAALGSPDPGGDNDSTDCNTTYDGVAADPTLTGARSACVSSRGAYDMVGNLWEWVADWIPLSTHIISWELLSNSGPLFSNDVNVLAGADNGPGALIRGGGFFIFSFGQGSGPGAGPLAVIGGFQPTVSHELIGFRCGREL